MRAIKQKLGTKLTLKNSRGRKVFSVNETGMIQYAYVQKKIALPYLSPYPKINYGNINIKSKLVNNSVNDLEKYQMTPKFGKVLFYKIRKSPVTEKIFKLIHSN